MSFVIRAKLHVKVSTYVFLTRDTCGMRDPDTGSLYYWSNNMAIGNKQYETEAAAWKMLARVKANVRDKATEFEIVPFEPGKQIFYLNGKVSPDEHGNLI